MTKGSGVRIPLLTVSPYNCYSVYRRYSMSKKTTIQVSPELHQFLKGQAIRKDESYDEILKRLLRMPKVHNLNREDVAAQDMISGT